MAETSHVAECRWERTTPAECEYRETHQYCPHPQHACSCPPASPITGIDKLLLDVAKVMHHRDPEGVALHHPAYVAIRKHVERLEAERLTLAKLAADSPHWPSFASPEQREAAQDLKYRVLAGEDAR